MGRMLLVDLDCEILEMRGLDGLVVGGMAWGRTGLDGMGLDGKRVSVMGWFWWDAPGGFCEHW